MSPLGNRRPPLSHGGAVPTLSPFIHSWLYSFIHSFVRSFPPLLHHSPPFRGSSRSRCFQIRLSWVYPGPAACSPGYPGLSRCLQLRLSRVIPVMVPGSPGLSWCFQLRLSRVVPILLPPDAVLPPYPSPPDPVIPVPVPLFPAYPAVPRPLRPAFSRFPSPRGAARAVNTACLHGDGVPRR